MINIALFTGAIFVCASNNNSLLSLFLRGHINLFRHRYLHRIEDTDA